MLSVAMNDAGWVGLGLLSAIFLANAVGIVDQTGAVRELGATGLSPRFVRPAVAAGQILQFVAAPALFFRATRPYAAVALAGFLAIATLAAHAFWRVPAGERSTALAGFLKNAAIMGGLVLAATWKSHV